MLTILPGGIIRHRQLPGASPMPAPRITFDQFRHDMLAAGYDEVVARPWPPGAEAPVHTHPFEADALVVQGEMWLTEPGGTARRLEAGDRFHLQANVPHEERYGPQGATYWVARQAG
jgi:hypothetical protein